MALASRYYYRRMAQSRWFSDPTYKHYQNSVNGGVAFCTTTLLDFAPLFAEPQIADLMVASLLDDCAAYHAKLYAFVVMLHHIHLLVQVPDDHDIAWLMARIKSNSARRILKVLSQDGFKQLSMRGGLGRRSFWQPSFRSIAVDSSHMFGQKVGYIVMNPVKAELCVAPELYRWSSARIAAEGLASWERGIHIDRGLINLFACEDLLRLGR